MVPTQNAKPDGEKKLTPDDVRVFHDVRAGMPASMREISIAKGVDDAMNADPHVRAFVESLLKEIESTQHQQKLSTAA
jgi:hypothetical protein